MPYVRVVTQSGITIGRTVDARIGKTLVQITPMSETLLRIEADGDHPAETAWILSAIGQDGRTTVCCLVSAGRATAAKGKAATGPGRL